MSLQDINKQAILTSFGSHTQFNLELYRIIKYLNPIEKEVVQDIIIYYNNVFSLEVDIASDVINLRNMALINVDILHNIYKKKGFMVVLFLANRIHSNLEYVRNLRKLA